MKWFEDGQMHFGLGIEDTFVPQTDEGERPLDEYELTEHYQNWHGDLGLAREVGSEFMRWGIPWYRVNPAPGEWDWSWVDGVIARFDELGIRPIIDLLHYGTPMWVEREFAHPDYPRFFEEYAARTAERYAATVTDYTPVNEPMIHARFSGDVGYWPPKLRGAQGYNQISVALADGFVRAQRAIADILGERATFVHVDASALFAGDVDGEHKERVELQLLQSFLVEDLVTGRVDAGHPMLAGLGESGVTDDLLSWFRDNAVAPDVMGVNYYPRHSTQLMQEGAVHTGGFIDPWPNADTGVVGLAELMRTYAERYGAPVMLSETCVTDTPEVRIDWMDKSVACLDELRAEGMKIVGYTWWPLFDMYEWTYRHATTPRADSLLTMGLYDLVETPTGLDRRRNPVADRFRHHATRHLPGGGVR